MLENLSKEELIELVKKLEKEKQELQKHEELKQDSLNQTQETKTITNEEKVKLFMDVFKCREDIYAKRWVSSKTGKVGYSPVCKNEFNRFLCDKSNVKCNNCTNRELLPLTEEVVLKHLKGEISIGISPLLMGDLCNFLAFDFDEEACGKTYEKDVVALWNTCDELNIPVYVERSRSGKGAHVWIFFEESISARLARKMGNILLTKTMEKASLDLNSYDRLFPNQDIMPKEGFGNLIALPFQGECAKFGNTVFVNKYFEPEKNQMGILKNIVKMSADEVLEFVQKYKEDDFKEPEFEDTDDELPQKEALRTIKFTNNIE